MEVVPSQLLPRLVLVVAPELDPGILQVRHKKGFPQETQSSMAVLEGVVRLQTDYHDWAYQILESLGGPLHQVAYEKIFQTLHRFNA